MFNIHKISQRYNQREDRIETAIQNESGKIIRLWLTQRLANRMVAVLVKWLPEMQELSTVEVAAKVAEPSSKTSEKAANPSTQKQSEQPSKDQSVDFNTPGEEGLLLSVDMSQQQKDYLLTFKWGVTGVASIKMGIEQLNSFIEGLIQLYRAAQWDLKVFPESRINTLTSKSPEFEDFPESLENLTRTIH